MAVETQCVDIVDCYSALEDPRQRTKVIYPLPEILLLVLCGVMAGADDFSEITRWGRLHVEFLRRFLPYREGIPSHDTVNAVIAALDGEAFRDAFVSWVAGLRAANQDGEVIAIDGKTSRRSGSSAAGIEPLHLVSAWASDQRLVLGQEALRGRDNEIVAIDRLLQWLEITGALVTIDAIGCQRKFAQSIIDKGADYLLALKANQPALHDDVALWFDDGLESGFAGARVDFHETVDADHGRIETRRHWVAHDIDWLKQRHRWPGLVAIAMIEREREIGAKTSRTRHFYIASLAADAVLIDKAARNHWHIENRLHWVLDVVFHDDLSRLRTNHGPHNMAIIRQTALNLIKSAKGKMSFKTARKAAGWSDDFLDHAINQIEFTT